MSLLLQRYEYYISRGVPDHSLASQDQEVMERILQKRIPEKLTRNTELDPLITKLKQEVVGDYDFSVRKSIGELKGHCNMPDSSSKLEEMTLIVLLIYGHKPRLLPKKISKGPFGLLISKVRSPSHYFRSPA